MTGLIFVFCGGAFLIFFAVDIIYVNAFRNRSIQKSIYYTESHIDSCPAFKELYNVVARLADRANIPTPALRIARYLDPIAMEAFHIGKRFSAITFEDGFVEQLTLGELEGLIAHEIGHFNEGWRHTFITEFLRAYLAASRRTFANFLVIGIIMGIDLIMTVTTGSASLIEEDFSLMVQGVILVFFATAFFYITLRLSVLLTQNMDWKGEFNADMYASNLLGGPEKVIDGFSEALIFIIFSKGGCNESESDWHFTTSSPAHPSPKDRISALYGIKIKKE